MRTILLPTDFSDTARNAAHYAIGFAGQTGASRIVLYHAYQAPVNVDPAMPTIQLLDLDELKKNSEQGLQNFLLELKAFCPRNVQLETLSEFALLAEDINDVCEKVQADIIIMGITGGSRMEEVLIGSNTVSVAHHTTTPVIIVPANTGYMPIKEIVLACDFKQVVESTPVAPLRKILDETGARLFVLNVSEKAGRSDADLPFESLMLDTLLQGYNPEYHFISHTDFTEAINQFALEKQVDLIITIPKKHGWFEGLFRRSHTKRLAFHTHVPLMMIHE